MNETIWCRFISPLREGYVILGGREAWPVDLGGTKILVCIFVVLPECGILSP